MNTSSTHIPLIVETRRGPCIAGTRITVFSVMDYLKGERSRDFIKHVMGISDKQLDAVLAYIILHKEAVEQEYTKIVRRSEERQTDYEKVFRSAHLSLHTCRERNESHTCVSGWPKSATRCHEHVNRTYEEALEQLRNLAQRV